MHILIVDDEVYIRELVVKYLKHENYESSFACDGKEAVEMVRNNNYDLVFIENSMDDMSGEDVINRVNATNVLLSITCFSFLYNKS